MSNDVKFFETPCINLGITTRPIGNYTASTQTRYLRNYHPLTLAILMGHTRTSVIPSLQQQNCQFRAVTETTTDRVRMRSTNTSTRFFYGLLRVKQIVQLLPPCCSTLMKNKKIAGPRLSKTSTLRTPVGWHGI